MAKKALIDNEQKHDINYATSWELVDGEYQAQHSTIEDCIRILDVVDADATFEVTSNLQWINCPDDCTPETYYYKDSAFTAIPNEPVNPGL